MYLSMLLEAQIVCSTEEWMVLIIYDVILRTNWTIKAFQSSHCHLHPQPLEGERRQNCCERNVFSSTYGRITRS